MSSDQTEQSELAASIRIETQSWFLEEQSNPNAGRYAFSYTISIHNLGTQPITLLNRHWLITDSDGHTQEVHGDGVIGEQPEIQPGKKHIYSSGTLIETPVGTMEGRYGMVSAAGENFDTPIPVFRLSVPGVLN